MTTSPSLFLRGAPHRGLISQPVHRQVVDLLILVIDDDLVASALLCRELGGTGFAVKAAPTLSMGISMIEAERPDAIVTEQMLPDGCVLSHIRDLREKARDAAILVLTRHASVAAAVSAVRSGAAGYMAKPANAAEVTAELQLQPNPSCRSGCDTGKSVMTLEQIEWEHISRVLINCDGNVSRAARCLRMHRRTLQRKLACGVPPDRPA